jgi:hypothetical protein
MTTSGTSQRPPTIRRAAAGFAIIGMLALAAGCGDDDDAGGDTVSVEAWVDQFDRICLAVDEALEPGLSEAEFVAFLDGTLTVAEALSPPDEQADTVAGIFDDMRAAVRPGVSDVEIDAIDERIQEAMVTLGVSDECIGGVDD